MENLTGLPAVVPPGPLVFENLSAAAASATLRWEPFREGIEVSWVYRTPAGGRAAFLRYAPGARLPRHEHAGYEHVFVLAGSQADDNGVYPAGALLVSPPGSSHAVASEAGCVALVVWEKPVIFYPGPESYSAPV